MKRIIIIIILLVTTYILARTLNYLSKKKLVIWYKMKEPVLIQNQERKDILWFMYFEIWTDIKTNINEIKFLIKLPDTHIMDIEFNCTTTCNVEVVSKKDDEVEFNIAHLAKDEKIIVGIFLDREIIFSSKPLLVIQYSGNTEIIAKNANMSSSIII